MKEETDETSKTVHGVVELNPDQLLYEEKEQVKNLENDFSQNLGYVFQKAAEKLERTGAFEDTKEICAYLSNHVWPQHERHLRKMLPAKYKRGYVFEEKEESEGMTHVQEALKTMADLCSEMARCFDMMLTKIRTEKDIYKRRQIENYLVEQFGTSSEFEKFLENLKELQSSIAYAKQLQDDRQVLGIYQKTMIKFQLLIYGKHDVANKIGMTAKWMKHGVEDEPDVQRHLKKLRRCINCGFDLASWYNKQAERAKRGLAVKEPPEFPQLEYNSFSGKNSRSKQNKTR